MSVHAMSEVRPIAIAKDQPGFVETPYVKGILRKAMRYVQAGLPIHFSGPAGTGKTTLALKIAAQLGQPVILIHGDEELGSSDLVGGQYGFRRKKVVDNYIQSVLKTEEDVSSKWVDDRLTVACKYGFTLIYDEFTRSRPEANNVLLSVLEEKMLDLPAARGEEGHLRVDPKFRAIFTSNPEEYAGVYKAQDALKDRMVTIKLDYYDKETEIAVTQAKAGVSEQDARRIVNIVRGFREICQNGMTPTIRASIIIGKVLRISGAKVMADDSDFVETCFDILDSEPQNGGAGGPGSREIRDNVMSLINTHCN
ncbi:MAG: gas vesicle protein GvpN [Pseudomonadota bacterium]